jgi:hemoglobin
MRGDFAANAGDGRRWGLREWPRGLIGVAVSGLEQRISEELGEAGLARLVSAFYRRVREDDLIGPMYPDDDWEGAEERLRTFLGFRFLGSSEYLLKRGHPRLRMRHAPFAIGEAERDRWMDLMRAAMREESLSAEVSEALDAFFFQVADFMRNR